VGLTTRIEQRAVEVDCEKSRRAQAGDAGYTETLRWVRERHS
jgi:hypothetical protein